MKYTKFYRTANFAAGLGRGAGFVIGACAGGLAITAAGAIVFGGYIVGSYLVRKYKEEKA